MVLRILLAAEPLLSGKRHTHGLIAKDDQKPRSDIPNYLSIFGLQGELKNIINVHLLMIHLKKKLYVLHRTIVSCAVILLIHQVVPLSSKQNKVLEKNVSTRQIYSLCLVLPQMLRLLTHLKIQQSVLAFSNSLFFSLHIKQVLLR